MNLSLKKISFDKKYSFRFFSASKSPRDILSEDKTIASVNFGLDKQHHSRRKRQQQRTYRKSPFRIRRR